MHGAGAIGLEHTFHGFGVVRHLGGVPVHFNQQNSASFTRQASLGVVVHAHDGVVVQKFKSTGHNVGGNNAGHSFGGVLHFVEYGHKSLGGLGRGHKFENGLGNDAQRAFGLHQHAGQVVARDALDRARTGFDDLARGVKKFNAHEVILGDAVLEAAQAASVFGNVAADGGYSLRTRIRGIEKIFLGDFSGELGGDDARFNYGIKVVGVDFNDAVKTVRQDDNCVGIVGDGAA